MANGHGGKRLGSGKPKGAKNVATLQKAAAQAVEREAFRDYIKPHVERLHSAQISHATGIQYLVARHKKSGKFVKLTQELADRILDGQDDEHDSLEIWAKDPSIQAYTDLMNRFMDKPKEQEQELAVHGKMIIEIAKGW